MVSKRQDANRPEGSNFVEDGLQWSRNEEWVTLCYPNALSSEIEVLNSINKKQKDVRNVRKNEPQGYWQMPLLAQNLKSL